MKPLSKEHLATLDKADMLGRVLAMPEHFRESLARAQRVELKIDAASLNGIVIVGMGGSAMSGDVARGLALDALALPLQVSRSYELPGWVNERSLVIVSSYSGNTEESLAAFQMAQARAAKIICITSGGKLNAFAQQNNLPVFSLPPGFPPRSALAHLTVPLLMILHRLGLTPDPANDINETSALLEKLGQTWGVEVDTPNNLAKNVAHALTLRLPIIYAACGLFEVAAWRWKEQFCENAEILSWHNAFPELNHNELVGWGLRRALDQNLQVIYLRDRQDYVRVQKRMEVSRELIAQSSAPVIEVWSEGHSLLARLFSLIFLGDLASVYLAVLNGVDPTPVKKIDLLKERLEQFHVA